MTRTTNPLPVPSLTTRNLKHAKLLIFAFASCVSISQLLLASKPAYAIAAQFQSLNSDDVNLSGKNFFKSYTSTDRTEKEKALLYLLGVQDATEGKSWCEYRSLKTVTLQEFVFEYFKKLPEQRLSVRASKLIQEALTKNFPCKKNKP